LTNGESISFTVPRSAVTKGTTTNMREADYHFGGQDWEVVSETEDGWELVRPIAIVMSGQGQGNAPKPPEKKQGTQHRQKEEKKKPKTIVRTPWKPKK